SCPIAHVAAMAKPCLWTVNGSQQSRSRSMSRRTPGCGSEKSQVPPASQASPSRQLRISSRDVGRVTSETVLRSISKGKVTAEQILRIPLPLQTAEARQVSSKGGLDFRLRLRKPGSEIH